MKQNQLFLGAALALACTFGLQSCTESDNPTYINGPEPPVVVDLNEAIAEAAAAGDDIVVTIPAGAEVNITEAIEAPEGKTLTIQGDENEPAAIKLASSILVSNSVTLENLVIDATDVTAPLVELNTTPGIEADESTYYHVAAITLKNVAVNGLQSYLIFDNNTKYCADLISIDNSVIQLATAADAAANNQALIRFQQGGAKDVVITNSTFYQTGEGNVQRFIEYNNSARNDRLGFSDGKTTMTYTNNTFYKVATGNWGNYSGISNNSTYDVQSNIWVECSGESGEIARRLMGNGRLGSGATATWNNNTYVTNGAIKDLSAYDTGTQLQTLPGFADPDKGDFTVSGADQIANKTGDPRWLK